MGFRARVLLVGLVAVLAGNGCGRRNQASAVIQNKGSDTMVNLAQAWAEAYREVTTDVAVEVSGGGSGVGIAALMRGTIDLANSSRDIKPKEVEEVRRHTGRDPTEVIAGYDALAIFVHRDNPIETITFEQLSAIFREDGPVTRWSQLGVQVPGCRRDQIIRVSRQSSSGTYEFFRERVLQQQDFKLGSLDMNGSKEVVELVGNTPCAIGYSGMGYANARVKMLKVAARSEGPAVAPTMENTLSQQYPIARSLHLYALGEPTGALRGYLDWILSAAGQRVVQECGYVPVKRSGGSN
jgi:phosphate transport system substrate-binding protein